jgi:hypothetical protein
MWLSSEYQALPVEQKAEFVWEHGTYLMCRCKGRYVVTLHEWESFFIEIWLDAVAQRVCMLFTFHGTDRLKPYLDKLPLPEGLQQEDSRTVY